MGNNYLKIILFVAFVINLSACSTFDEYADKSKNISAKAGQSLGLISDRKMQVPAYYSTEYLPKNYMAGQVIELESLDCKTVQECMK